MKSVHKPTTQQRDGRADYKMNFNYFPIAQNIRYLNHPRRIMFLYLEMEANIGRMITGVRLLDTCGS